MEALLGIVSIVVFVVGLVCLVRPIKAIPIPTRGRAAIVMCVSFAGFVLAARLTDSSPSPQTAAPLSVPMASQSPHAEPVRDAGIVLATWRLSLGAVTSANTLAYRDGKVFLHRVYSGSRPLVREVTERPSNNPGERKFEMDAKDDRGEYITLSAAGDVRYFSWEGRNFETVTATFLNPDLLSVGFNPVAKACVPKELSTAASEVLALYRQLHAFKDEPDFRRMGFSPDGPYNAWLGSAKAAHQAYGFEVEQELGVLAGDVMMLGMSYMEVATDPSGRAATGSREHIEDTERRLQAGLGRTECASPNANDDSAITAFQQGLKYRKGDGVPKDDVQAARWFHKAAGQGHAKAQFNLGVLYQEGEGVPQDDVEAARLYRLAADQGLASAQFNIGMAYGKGVGLPKDNIEAVRWLRLAADQGHAKAQFNLGGMYARGDGVPADNAEAVRWYQKAASQGSAVLQAALGFKYAEGEGIPKDDTQAVRWLRSAAEQGLAGAQFALGRKYAEGEGVPKDGAQALRWYRLAAEQGLANVQFYLGVLYAEGEDVPPDDAEAARWFRLAAEQGHADAQFKLAAMYSKGEGVPENDAKALEWLRLAAEQGHAGASSQLTELTTPNALSTPAVAKNIQPPASPADAIKVVGATLETNQLAIKPADLKAISNPAGEGVLVYVPKTRFFGVKRNILWMVIDGQAYSLNGATKGVTPNLPWPREAPDSVWIRTNLDKFSSMEAHRLVFGDGT